MKTNCTLSNNKRQFKKQELSKHLKNRGLTLNQVFISEAKSNTFVYDRDFPDMIKSSDGPVKCYVGPWKDVEEFTHIHKLLYGEACNLDTYRQALNLLAVWKLRRSTLCPSGVLCTQILLEVILKDDTYTKESESKSCYINDDLQSLYSFAIIRFYNLISSTVQEYRMRSMYDTARLLEINSVVVDIRHLCSHGQVLPDLSMLRCLAKYCLKWIGGHYWLPIAQSMENVKPEEILSPMLQQLSKKLNLLLQIYDSAFLCFVQGASDIQNARSILKGKRYRMLESYSNEFQQRKLRSIINLIVNNLSEIFNKARTTSPDDAEAIENIYIDGLLTLKHFYKFPFKKSANSGFAKLYDSGQSLFRMLSVNGILKSYFMALMRVAEETQRYGPEYFCGAAFWAKRLVDAFEIYSVWRKLVFQIDYQNLNSAKYAFSKSNFSEVPKNLRALLESQGINTRFNLIFGYTNRELWDMHFLLGYVKERLHNINANTYTIVKSLLSLTMPPLQSELKANLLKVLELQLKIYPSDTRQNTESIEDPPIYTAANLKPKNHRKRPNSVLKIDSESNVNSPKTWWPSTGNAVIDWSVTPLGKTPWEVS